eukprot:SAG31_NODE_31080_length_372_cov_1.135531_1_plen_117_part_10
MEVRGAGFSMDEHENKVLVNGRPCVVSHSTLELIQCVTTPITNNSATIRTATCGNYSCPAHLMALPNQTALLCRNANSTCGERDCCGARSVADVVNHDEVRPVSSQYKHSVFLPEQV